MRDAIAAGVLLFLAIPQPRATEAGSALLKNRVPGKDAEVLTTATLMGLVCLGKTHMSELAFSGLGLNPVTATPPCINDDRAVPGGSSSGAAASVAFGLARPELREVFSAYLQDMMALQKAAQ